MKLLVLDLQLFSGEKTEQATPKKRQDARNKGQVAKSQDVNMAINMLAVFLFLWFAGSYFKDLFIYLFRHSFQEYLTMDLTESNVQYIFFDVLQEIVLFLGPVMLVALIAGIAANYMQIGFLFSTEAIQFKLEKLDPIKGFKRIFALRAIVELVKSILKISFVGIITFSVLWMRKEEILILSQKSVGASLVTIANLTVQMGLIAAISLLFLSLLDYLYQKFEYEKSLRMSKQDIKDEHKNSEGDPQIKGKIKQKQREMAMRRMMQEVPNADVVITNPTHYAVALKYDENKIDAPVVIAKGVDFMAQKIKYIAKENEVITVENRPLARALYSQTEVGDVIPEEFFKAVAEILAYVYKTKNKI